MLINAHLRHIATNHNHCFIYVILFFIRQTSRCQKEPKRWRTSLKTSSSSWKNKFKTTKNIWKLTRKTSKKIWKLIWKTSKKHSEISQHSWWIRLTFRNTHQPRRIHQILRTLSLWSLLTGGLHHWNGDALPKLVACGPSNMISAHQNSMSSSSRHNSKDILLRISNISLTTSRCVSMRWLYSENTYFLITSPSKDTLILNNILSQIANTLPTPGMSRYTLPLDTHS